MRPTTAILCALSLTACGAPQMTPPDPVVIRQRPPEALTRCPAAPEPPNLPPLAVAATVPRAAVVQRDVATGRWVGQVLASHALCRANSMVLRRFLGFDQVGAGPGLHGAAQR